MTHSLKSRILVCKHCGNPASLHWNNGTRIWRHERNQYSPPSCGKKLTKYDIRYEDFEAAPTAGGEQ